MRFEIGREVAAERQRSERDPSAGHRRCAVTRKSSLLAPEIEKPGRQQLVVCGIEAHVCVLQTVLSALDRGFKVGVPADAVGSRDEANRQLALLRMRDACAVALSSEMILFEWMGTARHPAFKAVSQLIK